MTKHLKHKFNLETLKIDTFPIFDIHDEILEGSGLHKKITLKDYLESDNGKRCSFYKSTHDIIISHQKKHGFMWNDQIVKEGIEVYTEQDFSGTLVKLPFRLNENHECLYGQLDLEDYGIFRNIKSIKTKFK